MNDTFKNVEYDKMVLFQKMEELNLHMEEYDNKLAGLRDLIVEISTNNTTMHPSYIQEVARIANFASKNIFQDRYDETRLSYSVAMKEDGDATSAELHDEIELMVRSLQHGLRQANCFTQAFKSDLDKMNEKKPNYLKPKGGLRRTFTLVEVMEIAEPAGPIDQRPAAKSDPGFSK